MEQHLMEADVSKALHDIGNEYEKLRRNYMRGILSTDDVAERVGQLFRDMTGDFLALRGFHYAFSSSGWQDFENAFTQWKAGKPTEDCSGEEWFFYDNADKRLTDKRSLEITRLGRVYGLGKTSYVSASMEDKKQFFRIVDQFGISPEYFKPLPDNVYLPKRHFTHTYNGGSTCIIDFNCIDDGGLCGSLSPAGKRFRLRDDLGLTADVLIKEVRTEKELLKTGLDIDDYLPLAKYLAEGTVEGYTSGRIRDITIRTDQNNVVCQCGTFLKPDDDVACNEFPLWQEGYQWSAHREGFRKEMCEKTALEICRSQSGDP